MKTRIALIGTGHWGPNIALAQVGTAGADEQVVDTVTVHVAGPTDVVDE